MKQKKKGNYKKKNKSLYFREDQSLTLGKINGQNFYNKNKRDSIMTDIQNDLFEQEEYIE